MQAELGKLKQNNQYRIDKVAAVDDKSAAVAFYFIANRPTSPFLHPYTTAGRPLILLL